MRLSTRPSVASSLNGASFGGRRPRLVAAASAGAFLLLAGLVWVGAFTWLDRYGVHHLMPWAHFGHHRLIQVGTAIFEPQTESTLGGTLVALWTYPASPFISGLIVLLCAWRLGHVAPALLWIAANAIELVGKLVVGRPSVGEPGFTHSFPSGHTLRAFVTAAVIGWTWRWAGPPAFAWAVGVACALVAIGDHVPTDVVGGALLAAALIGAVRGLLRRTTRAESVSAPNAGPGGADTVCS